MPSQVSWTPQQLADAIASRMRLVTAQTFALFVTGSTEPSSNVGPWFRNGNELYVWSDSEGGYVPITIPAASLGYFIGSTTPDQNIYSFWIQTDALGSPLALKTYYSGAWVDVYATTLSAYLTIASAALTYAPLASPALTGTPTAPTAAPGTNTTQLATTAYADAIAALKANIASPALTGTPTAPTAAPGTNTTQIATTAFVTTAIAGIPSVTIVAGQGIFKAIPALDQDVVFGAGGNQAGVVTLGTETFDPDGVFAASAFTAPANGYYTFQAGMGVSVPAGAPTNIDLRAYFGVNGAETDSLIDEPISTSLAGRVLVGATTFVLSAGDVVTLRYNFTLDAAGTVRIATNSFLTGYRIR